MSAPHEPPRQAVLVVDDDPGMLSLAHLLLAEDYALCAVQTRAEALATLKDADFRVLIADLHLPDGSGLDVLASARRELPDLEGILMTGHTSVETATSAVELGLHAYMSKPFDAAELERMVRTAMEKSEFRRRLRLKKEQLERTNAELHSALEQLRAAQQAQIEHERLASIGMIAAGIAHEINNPAAFVAANVEMIEERVRRLHRHATRFADEAGRVEADAILAELLEMRADAREGMSRIVSITRDLKTFGKKEDRRQAADVNAVVASVIRICGHHVRRHARLVEELGEVPRVWASPESLNQVFLNLLVNAAQACETTPDACIRVRTFVENDRVAVEVRDNAGGIPEAIVERVWEPFFTTKPKGVGTGLGLSIVRRIVADHGGNVDLVTAPGEGTAFTVMLPPCADTVMPAPVAVPADERRGPVLCGRRILVVDDEIPIQRALRSALGGEFEVVVASDGSSALDILDGTAPDLILSDLYMTPMDGVELYTAATRRDGSLADRFLFMSGSPSLSRKLPGNVRHGVLLKPFTIAELRRAIESAFTLIDAAAPASGPGGG
jgi:signal transduction histidine kinase